MRKEKDYIGEADIPRGALYGIHSRRARDNFPDTTPFHPEWYRSLGQVKRACHITARRFFQAARDEFPGVTLPVAMIDDEILQRLDEAAQEVSRGLHFEHFIVPAVSGGAGTSINMNINEIIANRALQLMGKDPGDYHIIDPLLHANIFQSTNDVVPTSLRLAVMSMLEGMESAINALREKTEALEKEHRQTMRSAYTQMQEAVPTSYGRLFSTYNDVLSRDWWRLTKCRERIKVVNLGGSAAGTGMAVPRYFIFEVVEALREITGQPLTRSENLADTTANLDSLVEVHGILKTHAVNLEKMASDMRLLAADITVDQGLTIAPRQAGSSIMPGKINPVISEFVIGACHRVYGNDVTISSLAAQGSLDLNPHLPVIGHALLESIRLLTAAGRSLGDFLFTGLEVNGEISRTRMMSNPSITTALVPHVGYHRAGEAARLMKERGVSITEANDILKLMDREKLASILEPGNLLQLGFSIRELLEESEKGDRD